MVARVVVNVRRPERAAQLWGRGDTRALGDIALSDLRSQIARREGSDGRGFGLYRSGPNRGRPITLQKSGALLDAMTSRTVGDTEVSVGSDAAHAPIIARRFPNALALGDDTADRIVEAAADMIGDRL